MLDLKDWNLFVFLWQAHHQTWPLLLVVVEKQNFWCTSPLHFYYTFFASNFYYPQAICRNFLHLPAWKGSLEEQRLSKFPINQLLFGIWVTWWFFFPNQIPFVSLDKASTLTISDLFSAHSSFQTIDPQNGLKLFLLLSLCFLNSFCTGWRWNSCLLILIDT